MLLGGGKGAEGGSRGFRRAGQSGPRHRRGGRPRRRRIPPDRRRRRRRIRGAARGSRRRSGSPGGLARRRRRTDAAVFRPSVRPLPRQHGGDGRRAGRPAAAPGAVAPGDAGAGDRGLALPCGRGQGAGPRLGEHGRSGLSRHHRRLSVQSGAAADGPRRTSAASVFRGLRPDHHPGSVRQMAGGTGEARRHGGDPRPDGSQTRKRPDRTLRRRDDPSDRPGAGRRRRAGQARRTHPGGRRGGGRRHRNRRLPDYRRKPAGDKGQGRRGDRRSDQRLRPDPGGSDADRRRHHALPHRRPGRGGAGRQGADPASGGPGGGGVRAGGGFGRGGHLRAVDALRRGGRARGDGGGVGSGDRLPLRPGVGHARRPGGGHRRGGASGNSDRDNGPWSAPSPSIPRFSTRPAP